MLLDTAYNGVVTVVHNIYDALKYVAIGCFQHLKSVPRPRTASDKLLLSKAFYEVITTLLTSPEKESLKMSASWHMLCQQQNVTCNAFLITNAALACRVLNGKISSHYTLIY